MRKESKMRKYVLKYTADNGKERIFGEYYTLNEAKKQASFPIDSDIRIEVCETKTIAVFKDKFNLKTYKVSWVREQK